MGLFSSLSKLVSNVGGGVGDIINNPVKAVKDGLNDPATQAALLAGAGGYAAMPYLTGAGAAGAAGAAGLGDLGATAAYEAGLPMAADAAAAVSPGAFGGAAAGLGDLGAAAAYEAGLPVAADAAAAVSPGAFGASGIPWAGGVDAGQGIGNAFSSLIGGNPSLINAGALLASGLLSSNAASNAAQSQKDATMAAIAAQTSQADRAYNDQAAYRQAGTTALGQLQTEMGQQLTGQQVMQQDPGYQFGLDQGQQALDRRAAAAGGRLSGASLKAAARYNQGYATTQYGAAYQRSQDRLNRLASLANIGQTSTQASAAAGSNASNQISGLLSSQGDATASAQLNQGRTWSNTANQLGALYGVQQPGYGTPTGYGQPTTNRPYGP